jgi:hypothetical protein
MQEGATHMNFKLKARLGRSDAGTIRQALDQLAAKGSVKKTAEGFMVETEIEGASARELNRTLLSALRKARRNTTLRAEWTSGDGTAERFFRLRPEEDHQELTSPSAAPSERKMKQRESDSQDARVRERPLTSKSAVRRREPPYRTGEGVREARTGLPFRHLLYRGEGLPEREKTRSRTPAQFAVGEHWTPDPRVALTYGPYVHEEEVSLANPYVFCLSGKGPFFEDMRAEFGTADPIKVTVLLKGRGHDGLVIHNVAVMRSYSRAGSTEVIKFGRTVRNRFPQANAQDCALS